ncbi:uncharacterized protein LOC124311124 [Daphnia pulicaria]|uniref:uncharacterized protein LOC124311124 n=1 Tax=Daphnia pulicaria TaxID=35523 RepID=UPI001EEB47AA|nr:uncharacterized protein LOC124311124 [Daphnia pulicaria]
MMNGTMTKENSFVKNRAKLFSCKSEEEPQNEVSINSSNNKKTPSYVSLSCAVSGYSGLNRYDSRIRSRDNSRDGNRLPLCLTKSRDSSPTRTSRHDLKTRKSSGGFLLTDITATAATPIEYQQQQQQNQQWNGRSKSVDRGYLRQNFLNGYLQYKPPTSPSPSTTTTATNNEERGRVRIRSSTVPHHGTQQDSKSVIQQRIERLYGPAALAGGFFLVKSPLKTSKEPLKSIPIHNNNNTQETTDGCATPPVFRHLNAEFRQQLKLKDKRSPESTKPMVATAELTIETTAATTITNNCTPITRESVESTNGEAIPVDDGHKFLKILDDEKTRIQIVIAKNELYLLESRVESSEELTGKVRAAVGKAKLLLAQKFEQFAGLCRKNLTQSPDEPFPTTGQDLAGFWDMVTIQVDHIDLLFAEIKQLRDNNWVEVIPEQQAATPATKPLKAKSKNSNNSSTPARSAKAQEAAKAREEARRKMMEERRKLAKAKKNDDWVIEEKTETIDLTYSQQINEEMVV